MPRLLVAALALLFASRLAISQSASPQPAVLVRVANAAAVEQERVACVTVPFARGELRLPEGGLCAIEASEVDPTSLQPIQDSVMRGVGEPLVKWADGSVAALSAQWRLRVPSSGVRAFQVRPLRNEVGAVAKPELVAHRPQIADALPIWTELVDPWGRTLRADLVADESAGKGGVVVDTGLVRVRRFRCAHRMVDGADKGRPLLDLTAWLVTFDEERHAELTLVLDNREPGNGPLGPVRFTSFALCVGDPLLRHLPTFAHENLMPHPEARNDKIVVQQLIATGNHYLGDGAAKAFRISLFQDDASLDEAARQVAAWGHVRFDAFADLDAVRASRAFGAFGGPAPVHGSDIGDDRRQLLMWRNKARFGPFGGFGDPEDARLGGAPRHGDSLLHNVLRWRSGALLAVAEGMALQHAMRPPGGRNAQLPADMEAYRQGLQPHALQAPHGFPRADYEHVSAQMLFDYWWLTGDRFAHEELARLGASSRAMIARPQFRTARGEGRCLEAGALAAMATSDRELLNALVVHAKDVLQPALRFENGCALPQPPHPLVLDGKHAFDSTSQMAALVRGLAALHRASEDPALLPMIARIADAMASSAWIEGEGPKTFLSASDVSRYSMAASPEDRSGNDRTLIGAFILAADLAAEHGKADLWRQRAAFLLAREIAVTTPLPDQLMASANPWLQVALDRRKQD